MYLLNILTKYEPIRHQNSNYEIAVLHNRVKIWAGGNLINIFESGSFAKGTAIHGSSDIDYLVSLQNNSNLSNYYYSLEKFLSQYYSSKQIRTQNVSIRVSFPSYSTFIPSIDVDITPARKHLGNTNYHSLYVSKRDTCIQANIQQHINDVSQSGRTNEIKLAKIWREINRLDFPSIYLEYLIIHEILYDKSKFYANEYGSYEVLCNNFLQILHSLASDENNPLYKRKADPSNSNNILSDLLNDTEKRNIINCAKAAMHKQYLEEIIM